MSAFDIAGAVVWTPLAFVFWVWVFVESPKPSVSGESALVGLTFAFATLGLAAFCIGRLFGAHL